MQEPEKFLTINVKNAIDTTIQKPRLCLLFDALDVNYASDFREIEYTSLKSSADDTSLTDLQKAAIARAFQQASRPEVFVTSVNVVIVKSAISAVNLQEALSTYWLVANYSVADLKFSEKLVGIEKVILNLITDKTKFTDISTAYPDIDGVMMAEVWFNGDLHAHTALATNYINRSPNTGAFRSLYLEPSEENFLTVAERTAMSQKAINDFIKNEPILASGLKQKTYYYSRPVLKDGSDLVRAYNKKVSKDKIRIGMFNFFDKTEMPYNDSNIYKLKIAILKIFKDLVTDGIVTGTVQKPDADFKVLSMGETPEEARVLNKFIVDGNYTVSGGASAIELRYILEQ